MDRPYQALARITLTRLALQSQEARVVAAAISEMQRRERFPKQIIEFANSHLLALTARDQALTDLQYFKRIFPTLEQRVRDLEARQPSPTLN